MEILYWKRYLIKGGSKVEREGERERGSREWRNMGYPKQGYPALEGMNRSCRTTGEDERQPSWLRAQEGGLLRDSRKKEWNG